MNADILTKAELDAIQGRRIGTTPGPWVIIGEADLLAGIDDLMIVASQIGPPPSVYDAGDDDLYVANIGPNFAPLGVYDATPQNLANARFIASAPADIDRLLTHVAALEAAMPSVLSNLGSAATLVMMVLDDRYPEIGAGLRAGFGDDDSCRLSDIYEEITEAADTIRALTPQPTQEPQP